MVSAILAIPWSLSDIWKNAGFLEVASAASTLILIVGAVIEEWPKLKRIGFLTAKVIAFRSKAFERCLLKKLLLHSVGAIMVVIGIVGELVFETRTFIVEDRETAVLRNEAGDAKQSASEAKASATATGKLLGQAQIQFDALNKEADALTVRMVDIKKAVDFQTPRMKILLAAAPRIVALLKPYAGQKVGLYVCEGNQRDFEIDDTWGALANILAGDTPMGLNKPDFFGAYWNEVPRNENFVKTNCGGMGITILVSTRSSEKTRKAAKALRDALFGALPPALYNHFGEIDPAMAQRNMALGFQDRTSPLFALAYDPDLVTVEIDTHPTQ